MGGFPGFTCTRSKLSHVVPGVDAPVAVVPGVDAAVAVVPGVDAAVAVVFEKPGPPEAVVFEKPKFCPCGIGVKRG